MTLRSYERGWYCGKCQTYNEPDYDRCQECRANTDGEFQHSDGTWHRHPERKPAIADCDLCGEHRRVFQVWYQGHMETWGCAKCLDREDEDDIENGQPEHSTFNQNPKHD